MKEMSLYYIFLLPSLAVNLVIHKNSLSYLFAKTFEKGYVVFCLFYFDCIKYSNCFQSNLTFKLKVNLKSICKLKSRFRQKEKLITHIIDFRHFFYFLKKLY